MGAELAMMTNRSGAETQAVSTSCGARLLVQRPLATVMGPNAAEINTYCSSMYDVMSLNHDGLPVKCLQVHRTLQRF